MRRVLTAFEPHCADSTLPRTLLPKLSAAGLDVDDVTGFPIINTVGRRGDYSLGILGFIAAYVAGVGTLPEEEVTAWKDEQMALAKGGRYFFSTMRTIFHVSRPA